MTLSFAEIKELIAYGNELGLQQLQTEGLVVVYGPKAIVQASLTGPEAQPDQDEVASITQMYAAMGRQSLRK